MGGKVGGEDAEEVVGFCEILGFGETAVEKFVDGEESNVE